MDSPTSNHELVANVEANSIQTINKLTPDQAQCLAKCEAIINKGLGTFIEVGAALIEIRDSRLYRAEFNTFEDYCRTKWKMSARQAYHLMDAHDVVETLKCEQLFTNEPLAIPSTESAARQLAKLDAKQKVEVARKVAKKTTQPVAEDFKAGVNEILNTKPHIEAEYVSEKEAATSLETTAEAKNVPIVTPAILKLDPTLEPMSKILDMINAIYMIYSNSEKKQEGLKIFGKLKRSVQAWVDWQANYKEAA